LCTQYNTNRRETGKTGGLKMKKYRIDNAYNKVYKYDDESESYFFYGSFYAIGIDPEMTEAEQIEIIEEDYYNF